MAMLVPESLTPDLDPCVSAYRVPVAAQMWEAAANISMCCKSWQCCSSQAKMYTAIIVIVASLQNSRKPCWQHQQCSSKISYGFNMQMAETPPGKHHCTDFSRCDRAIVLHNWAIVLANLFFHLPVSQCQESEWNGFYVLDSVVNHYVLKLVDISNDPFLVIAGCVHIAQYLQLTMRVTSFLTVNFTGCQGQVSFSVHSLIKHHVVLFLPEYRLGVFSFVVDCV